MSCKTQCSTDMDKILAVIIDNSLKTSENNRLASENNLRAIKYICITIVILAVVFIGYLLLSNFEYEVTEEETITIEQTSDNQGSNSISNSNIGSK